MVTTLPVVDLPAITPAGHFMSERCLGHDSKILIRRFRGAPTMSGNLENRKRKRVDGRSILTEAQRGLRSLNCYDGCYESLTEKSGLYSWSYCSEGSNAKEVHLKYTTVLVKITHLKILYLIYYII